MREIKFRGKRLDNGEWVYGDLIQYGGGKAEIHTCFDDELKSGKITSGLNRVDPNTIGQFTGSRDKNGKEIYEGDIVKSGYFIGEDFIESRAVIAWNMYFSMFEQVMIGDAAESQMMDVPCEVVGNEHESKEE